MVETQLRFVVALVAALWVPAAAAADAPQEPFVFQSLAGEPVAVEPGSADAPLVLHFFATWCPSCGDELKRLDALAARCDAVRLVLVDAGEAPDVVRRWAEPLGLRAPVVVDEGGRTWRRLGFRGLPATRIEGKAAPVLHEGALSVDAWRARLTELGCRPGA